MKKILKNLAFLAVMLCLHGCSGGEQDNEVIRNNPIIAACINLEGYSKVKHIGVERPFVVVRTKEFDTPTITLIAYSKKVDLSDQELEKVKTIVLVEDEYNTSFDYGKNGKKITEIARYKANVMYFDVHSHTYMERTLTPGSKLPESIRHGYSESVSDSRIMESVLSRADGLRKFAHKDAVNELAFSPDGKLLVSGGADGCIKLWSLPEGTLLKTLSVSYKQHSEVHRVLSLAITPDGKMLVSCGADHTIRFWSLPEGNPLKVIDCEKALWSLAISPDGKMLASSGHKKAVKLWSLPDGAPVATLEYDNYTGETTGPMAFSSDGRFLVLRGDKERDIQVWSMPEGARSHAWKTPYMVVKLCVSPNGKWLISDGNMGVALIWELPQGVKAGRIQTGGEVLRSWAVSADSKILIGGDMQNRIMLWGLPGGEKLGMPEEGQHQICSLAASPDGKIFASGKSNGALQLWALPQGTPVARLWDAACSPDY